jgi:hypothetical protein
MCCPSLPTLLRKMALLFKTSLVFLSLQFGLAFIKKTKRKPEFPVKNCPKLLPIHDGWKLLSSFKGLPDMS